MARLDYARYGTPDGGAPTASSARILAIEEAVRRLPPMPAVMSQLLAELGNVEADIDRLENRISTDPTLTTRLLRMANSAYYSPRARVCSVGQALMMLGLRAARNLVVATAMRAVLGTARAAPGFTSDGIFAHSVGVAVCCSRLGLAIPSLEPHAESLFVAGLLHDIGMVALSEIYGRERDAFVEAGGVTPETERRILGVDHGTVGRMVWEEWRLPDTLLSSISRHHDAVEDVADDPVTLAVKLADEHADLAGRGLEAARGDATVRTACALRLGSSDAVVSKALAGFEREAASLLGSMR